MKSATEGLQIYLVGGAVRDHELGLPVKERDWVVVGETVEEMLRRGFRQVGKDFPVFLHPRTHEEYALARTERKTAPGYHGFSVSASPDVTLEEDLLRRDLTINAIARSEAGDLTDPFGGLQDLEARTLRHVSDAFAEDPVRVLRIARFAARYHHLGFTVAPETNTLMQRMVASAEVDNLVPERVWQETHKALTEASPWVFFEVLRDCGALAVIFPEISALFGVPQTAKHHPEIDCGVHTLMALTQATKLSSDPQVRFAALVHDLGKATTPVATLPQHIGHESRSATLVLALCERMKIPNQFRDLAHLVAKYHTHIHRAAELKPSTILRVIEETDAFRKPQRFEQLLLGCEADARGRLGLESQPYPQANAFRIWARTASATEIKPILDKGLKGLEVKQAIHRLRVESIKQQPWAKLCGTA